MSVAIEQLKDELEGMELPGSFLEVSILESHAVDEVVRAGQHDSAIAHPIWCVIASLRGMGISVERLGDLAREESGDVLLFGDVEVVQELPLIVGSTISVTAGITKVDRRLTREGHALDSVIVVNRLLSDDGVTLGTVTCTYLFKRGAGSS